MQDFKFTVITPFYNSELYIEECIESLINQTLDFKENIQLILVDDGSKDDSYNLAVKYREAYPENILILKQENGGPSYTVFLNKTLMLMLRHSRLYCLEAMRNISWQKSSNQTE